MICAGIYLGLDLEGVDLVACNFHKDVIEIFSGEALFDFVGSS